MMFGPAAGRLVGIIVETGALVEMADRLLFCLNCPTAYYGKGASATVTFFGGNTMLDIVPYWPSSGASLSSPTISHTSHYRTLTSTATEPLLHVMLSAG